MLVFKLSLVLHLSVLITASSTNRSKIRTSRFVDSSASVPLEDVDVVLTRLQKISQTTTSKIDDLRTLQKNEFEINNDYKSGWAKAVSEFNRTKRQQFYVMDPDIVHPIVRHCPEEYHIALIAYSMKDNTLFKVFNQNTRELRSDQEISKYRWKSYFKLLQLAIEKLGKVPRWKPSGQKLYRGVNLNFALKKGQTKIAFQQFTSTSENETIAQGFAEGVTLFEFHGVKDVPAMKIRDHSVYKSEEEILFSPAMVFQVEDVKEGKPTKFVLRSVEWVPGQDHGQGRWPVWAICLSVASLIAVISIAIYLIKRRCSRSRSF